jgi:hypothetical protein
MISTYAQVENNVVVNVVEADAEWIAEQPGEWIQYTEESPCGIGWDVVDGSCVVPVTPSPFPID